MSNPIDDIVKKALSSHQITPDKALWERLDKSLESSEQEIIMPWYYSPKKAILAALIISLFSFGGGYFIASFSDDDRADGDKKNQYAQASTFSSQQILNSAARGERLTAHYSPTNNADVKEKLPTSENSDAINEIQNVVSDEVKRAEENDFFNFDEGANALKRENALATSGERDINTLFAQTSVNDLRNNFNIAQVSKIVLPSEALGGDGLIKRYPKNSISFFAENRQSGFSQNPEADRYYRSHFESYESSLYGVAITHYMSKHVFLQGGANIEKLNYEKRDERMFVNPAGNNLWPELTPDTVVVRYQTNYQNSIVELPVAVGVAGEFHNLTLRAQSGLGFRYTASSSSASSINHENWRENFEIHDEKMGNANFAVNAQFVAGAAFKLTPTLSLNVDAVLRKRLTTTHSQQQIPTNRNRSLRYGLTYHF